MQTLTSGDPCRLGVSSICIISCRRLQWGEREWGGSVEMRCGRGPAGGRLIFHQLSLRSSQSVCLSVFVGVPFSSLSPPSLHVLRNTQMPRHRQQLPRHCLYCLVVLIYVRPEVPFSDWPEVKEETFQTRLLHARSRCPQNTSFPGRPHSPVWPDGCQRTCHAAGSRKPFPGWTSFISGAASLWKAG